MKTIWIVTILFLGVSAQARQLCPSNDFKACGEYLKKAHQKDSGRAFQSLYQEVCETNSQFKCTRVTVMSEPDAVMKEMAQEKPKAHLFLVQQDDGKYIYVFDRKTAPKK